MQWRDSLSATLRIFVRHVLGRRSCFAWAGTAGSQAEAPANLLLRHVVGLRQGAQDGQTRTWYARTVEYVTLRERENTLQVIDELRRRNSRQRRWR